MDSVWAYHSRLEQRARDAAPGLGWYFAITKASLPWVVTMLPVIAVAALTSAPFWVVLAFWAVPMVGWLFVQFTMLSEIARIRRERR
jgi:hypothetical protein